MTNIFKLSTLLAILLLFGGTAVAQEWPAYGGDAGGRHYSTSGKIDRSNVGDLELAWSFQHGELEDFAGPRMTASWHVTPILLHEEAGRSLVICTPFNRVIALDPVTGEERWAFDPEVGRVGGFIRHNCRGVAYWQDLEAEQTAASRRSYHRQRRPSTMDGNIMEDGMDEVRPASGANAARLHRPAARAHALPTNKRLMDTPHPPTLEPPRRRVAPTRSDANSKDSRGTRSSWRASLLTAR